MKKILAIIPVRRGSKGLKGKNYKNLLGKPLLFWSIEAALNSNFIDIVAISTNDEIIISKVRKQYGKNKRVIIVKRPDSISGEASKTEEAMVHTIEHLESNGMSFDIVCLLQATSPFRTNDLVSRCLKEMINSKRDSVMTVSKHTPFFWKYKSEQEVEALYSITKRPMRQELSLGDFYFHDNGNVYACKTSLLQRNIPRRIGNNPILVETSLIENLQIDTLEEFQMIETIAKQRGGLL